ncbi:hypothetical protein DCC79_02045 [bacterium]|nr:phage holin family protein [Chloroflexi bacterium CFX6]RIL12266.1 MAG: hypothetical protein DCC79_02045 [bacterium]
MKLLLRIVINAAALWAATRLIDGIAIGGDVAGLLVVAVVFGVVNAFVRPLVALLTFPITLVTLGLFTLVINALMLMLTDRLSATLDIAGTASDQFVTALVAGIVISIVSTVLSAMLVEDDDRS